MSQFKDDIWKGVKCCRVQYIGMHQSTRFSGGERAYIEKQGPWRIQWSFQSNESNLRPFLLRRLLQPT